MKDNKSYNIIKKELQRNIDNTEYEVLFTNGDFYKHIITITEGVFIENNRKKTAKFYFTLAENRGKLLILLTLFQELFIDEKLTFWDIQPIVKLIFESTDNGKNWKIKSKSFFEEGTIILKKI